MRMDYPAMYELAEDLKPTFRTNQPFPNVVIDGFLRWDVYAEVCAAFPDPVSSIWKRPENAHTKGKLVTKRGSGDLKELQFSAEARQVFFELHSGLFLRFLSTLTGIRDLVADPYFAEGGFHCSEDGGFLDIHADFSHHDLLGLERRVNLLLYLNDDWVPEFGGALALYDAELTPVLTVPPVANRAVIFETSETSFHGHPEPMRLPAGVYRKSIALYYYSVPRPSRVKTGIVFPTDQAFAHAVTRG